MWLFLKYKFKENVRNLLSICFICDYFLFVWVKDLVKYMFIKIIYINYWIFEINLNLKLGRIFSLLIL